MTPDGFPTVGIVGGGQLARMMIQAAIPLGIGVRLLSERADDSAARVCPEVDLGSPDDIEVLRAFAKKYDVDLATWSFLTGDYETVKRTSEESFKMTMEGKADAQASGFGIVHGSHLVLVAQDMQIRGFYQTKTEDELGKLLEDAKSLSK